MKRVCLVLAGVLAASLPAYADGPLKVGLIAPFSGPFADYGKEMDAGIKAYFQQHGDSVAGRRIEIIVKDTTGPSPEIAKRLAQELVVRDQVDFLAGFGLTPEALAVADIATQAKKPMIVMNAASSVVTTKSPYIVRFSMALPQVVAPLGAWAAKNGIKKVFTLVSDYAPGRFGSRAVAQPRIRSVPAAHQGYAAAGRLRLRAGRRAGHRLHEGLSGARLGAGRYQSDRHR